MNDQSPRSFVPWEEFVKSNSSFALGFPGFQFAWDSTSLRALKKCPRYYFYTVICGYRAHAESPHLTFGLAMHSALECYDKTRAGGLDHEASLREAVRHAMIDTWGWQSDMTNKNRETLVRCVVWYLDHFGADDPAKTYIFPDGRPAVELSFRIDSGREHAGTPIILCGHLDKIVEFQSTLWVLDRKTTGSTISSQWFDQFTPDSQFSQYAFAGAMGFHVPVKGVIVDGIQAAVGFNRFGRGFAHRPEPLLTEWYTDAMEYVEQAARYAEAAHWPMNDTACSMYGGCTFRGICSKSPSSREAFLQAGFTQVQWDPMIPR